MLVVSGGEPLLQQKALLPLLIHASGARWWIEIETAATVAPAKSVASIVSQFNVSPKLKNSDNPRERRYRPAVLDSLQATGKATWKFVVQEATDLDEVAEIVERHSLAPVYVMPEGTDLETISARARVLADRVLANGWNLTPRLQILLHGAQRGV